MVYPETPATFWSFSNALKFIAKKSADPPLGLITVASMLPPVWEKKLIDMNASKLRDRDLVWADYVFLSGMSIHRESFMQVVKRCNELGVKVVAGGPLATVYHEELDGVDHFILNEAEITLPIFLDDFEKGKAEKYYTSDLYAELTETPIPDWGLLDLNKYATMDIQYSRGCPYDCEFCSITSLFGRKPRTKDTGRFLAELDSLYQAGWRDSVFIVDDNFIGNKRILKQDLLPKLITWSEERQYPFSFYTEASINLADDEELMALMVRAGFRMVFVGIETPNEDSLTECGKTQNRGRNLVESVNIIQSHGLEVTGGFIVGFDNDGADIFDRQIRFIQKSGIVSAMVGLLNAPFGTNLYKRLKEENRIVQNFSGDNTDGSLNFIPVMDSKDLRAGYNRIIKTVYSGREYFERIKTFLGTYQFPQVIKRKKVMGSIIPLFKAILKLGIIERERKYFWKLLILALRKYPDRLYMVIRMAIYGFHFRKVAESSIPAA